MGRVPAFSQRPLRQPKTNAYRSAVSALLQHHVMLCGVYGLSLNMECQKMRHSMDFQQFSY